MSEKVIKVTDTISLHIPTPYIDNDVEFISINGVVRPTCKYGLKRKDGDFSIISFNRFMELILSDPLSRMGICKYDISVLNIIRNKERWDNNFITFVCRAVQSFIDKCIYKLPVHKTFMNSWAINNRVTFIDEDFDKIVDPNKKLEYQEKKADTYFDRGWSLIGLSDSNLSDRNYIFTDDLRKYTAFGIKHHNPQRNLYQTLGMKGDELPALRSISQQKLINKGIKRTGWNAATVFVDVPPTFEDQILIHRNSWKQRKICTTKTYTIYGEVCVFKGQEIKRGDIIGRHHNASIEKFKLFGDKHVVTDIERKKVFVGNAETEARIVTIETTRYFKEGFKLTNTHGNKGIVRMFDDGYTIHDPVYGDITPEVIVSFKSVTKRKNFGQVFEALITKIMRLSGDNPMAIPDDFKVTIEGMLRLLHANGWDAEVTEIDTPYGKVKAIWGFVFWGCIKTAEENIWDEEDTHLVNSRGHRVKGLKFSHMEFRSLMTMFGCRNPVSREILSYANTGTHVKNRLASISRKIDTTKPVINYKDIKTLDPAKGSMHPEIMLADTIADEEFYPDGCTIEIPNVTIDIDNESFTINKIQLPPNTSRGAWQHKCGLFCMDTICYALNNALFCAQAGDSALYSVWMHTYYRTITKALGSKTGELAQLGMAIRYPDSVKATAVGSDTLPRNTVQIHSKLARQLKVKTGDVVLVERFPCLGFMSLRAQYVDVTNDPDCRYTIRVSGNSLVSQNLDFDGDTLFIASFHTKGAINAIRAFLEDQDSYINQLIEKMNAKKKPAFLWGGFEELNPITFPTLTKEQHRNIVSKAVGVKAHTGPVIATAYNLMRISEHYFGFSDSKKAADIEVMLDFLGNTVFSQKHGIVSLHDKAVNAICSGDVEEMAAMGFDKATSKDVIDAVVHYALELKIYDLKKYHEYIKENGGSNIVTKIVRKFNKVYFASRAIQAPNAMLAYVNAVPVDIPSHLFRKIIA